MKICGFPFYQLPIQLRGENLVFSACCSSWNKYPYEDFRFIIKDTNINFNIKKIWNSEELIEFRKSILDNSYRYCDKNTCPFLSSGNFLEIPEKAIPYITKKDPYLNYPPIQISMGIDPVCNLSCPMCRNKKNRIANPKTYSRFIRLLKSGVEDIFINPTGEIFANTHMLKVMREFSIKDFPAVKNFKIITNGTLLNKTMWYNLSNDLKSIITEINISIDSFSESTYNLIRPGAHFKNLLKNVKFISDLRQSGAFKNFRLLFVIQKKNSEELIDIVKSAIAFKPDGIEIREVTNWYVQNLNFYKKEIMLPKNFRITHKSVIQEARKMIDDANINILTNIL